MQLDEALELLGSRGKYHVIIFIAMSLITIRDPWQLLAISFIGHETPHSCRDPPLFDAAAAAAAVGHDRADETTVTAVETAATAAAASSVTSPPPLSHSLNRTASLSCADRCSCGAVDPCRAYVNESSNDTVPCQHGWRYETEFVSKYHYGLDYETTVVMEWDLVCERSGLVELSVTVYMVGVLIGSMLSPLSDKYGRKRVLLVALWLQGALGIAKAFVTDYVQFVVVRFFIGAANQISVLVGYVYLVELYPASSRTGPGIFVQVFWGVGVALLAVLAFLFKNWRYLQLAISVPSLMFIPLCWILPESIVWLVNNGKIREAEQILEKAAKVNGKSLPKRCLAELEPSLGRCYVRKKNIGWLMKACDEQACRLAHPMHASADRLHRLQRVHEHDPPAAHAQDIPTGAPTASGGTNPVIPTAIDLFRTPTMRLYTLVLFFIWFTVSGNYLSLSLNASELYGNKYINFGIGGLVEIPAYLITAPAVQRFGRRGPLLFFTILCGVANIGAVLVPKSSDSDCEGTSIQWVVTSIVMLGKFGITASYGILYLMTPEVFPTSVRTVGVGLCSFCDTVGGMCAPLIDFASHVVPWLQAAILGVMAAIAGLSVLFLPETHNRLLPTEVKDVEAWAKENTTRCSLCCHSQHKEQVPRKSGL